MLRQVGVLAQLGDVTTVGYGAKPPGVARHIEIDPGANSLPRQPTGVLRLATRQLRSAELAAPGIQQALERARGTSGPTWSWPTTPGRCPSRTDWPGAAAPVWADMHEWAPEEFSHNLTWRVFVKPLMVHNCRVYLSRAPPSPRSVSRSPTAIREFGVTTGVVRNAGAGPTWRRHRSRRTGSGWSTAAGPSRPAGSTC